VIVIHKGQIRASDTAENLLKNHRALGSMRIEAKVPIGSMPKEALSIIPGVKDVQMESDGENSVFHLRIEANADPSEAVVKVATAQRWSLRELVRRRPTLEDVFVELTHSDS
jgi:ABC-type multidrug transport system ATPase subunit